MSQREEVEPARSAETLRMLREQLARILDDGDFEETRRQESGSAEIPDIVVGNRDLPELFTKALKALLMAQGDAGRLDALLEHMEHTDLESEELLHRADRVRERLKAAAS